MSKRWSTSCVAIGLLAVGGLVVMPAPGAAAQSAGVTPIAGTASPDLHQGAPLVAVGGRAAVSFELVLNPRDPAGAEALATAVSTPGSPSYGRFLTPAQWEARFSPTTAQVAQVRAWLRAQGLRVPSVSADRLAVEVAGTSAGVERAFDTTLGYRMVAGQQVRAAETNLSVPSSLAGIVAGSVGLNETSATAMTAPTRTAHTRAAHARGGRTAAAHAGAAHAGAAHAGAAARQILPPTPPPVAPPCSQYYGQKFDTTDPPFGVGYLDPLPYVGCGYTPAQMRTAYGTTSLVATGDTGAGQTVALIDAYASPTLFSDAQTYFRTNDPGHPLAASQFSEITARSFNGVEACSASGWYTESALDVEAVHAMAPGAHILYVGTKNCNLPLYDALRTVVDRHLADIVSASWSDEAGDVLDDTGLRTSVGNTLLMAASTGVSVVFASGDDGDEYANTGRVAPDFPPSSPWATAVGGTTLELGFGVRQLGWSTGLSYRCTSLLVGSYGCTAATINRWLAPLFDTGPGRGGSGGGTSYQYSQPAYQIGVVPAALATRNGPTPMRVEPDISMDGDPGTGFLEGLTETTPTGVRYGQFAEGGTSLSAPLFAGLVALADQAHRGSLGFLNPALYSLDRADPAAIYDVGAMSGQAQSQISYDNNFDASGGYDDATRIDDYQGTEAHCVANLGCTSRTISLSAGTGYDDMTGLGTPASGFVPALARL